MTYKKLPAGNYLPAGFEKSIYEFLEGYLATFTARSSLITVTLI